MDAEAPRVFNPSLLRKEALARISQLIKKYAGADVLPLARALRSEARAGSASNDGLDDLRHAVASSLLADLCEQGWQLNVSQDRITIAPPSATPSAGESVDSIKSRFRQGLMRASDIQLATDSVQDFLRSMEKPRVYNGKVVSVESVVDSGDELAILLEDAVASDDTRGKLEKIVKPVLQVCEADSRCRHTGLKLQDIWRYFRHTWALEYNPLPGRTLRFLIRNAARPNHPVMGIALLASPAANLYTRDEWIGWTTDNLIARLVSDGEDHIDPRRAAESLMREVEAAISDIRSDDLVTKKEMTTLSPSVFFKLEQLSITAKFSREKDLRLRSASAKRATKSKKRPLIDIRGYQKDKITNRQWRELSSTSLFVKKRAEQLLPLLRLKQWFLETGFQEAPGAALMEALATNQGRAMITRAIGEVRKRKLATEIADLSVCGAVEPYSALLGGKLVALLLASREAADIYAERYSSQPSEIASQIAGKKVVRSANLKVLTTTSLYGVGSSQYNRLRLRRGASSKLERDVVWEELKDSVGFSITHLSRVTVELMKRLGEAKYGITRINSVFGEGSSPKTRQVREGLNLIGINNDHVLMQSIGRKVYACELFPGARDELCGWTTRRPKKNIPRASAIADGWIARYLTQRITHREVLDRLRGADRQIISRQLRQRAMRGKAESDRRDDWGSQSTLIGAADVA